MPKQVFKLCPVSWEPYDVGADAYSDFISCYHQGACDDDVAAFLRRYEVQVDEDALRRHLKEYGAWSDSELADHEDNLARLVWLSAADEHENDHPNAPTDWSAE